MGTSSNYSAASNNMKFVHWPLIGVLSHLVQRGRDWAGPQLAQAPHRYTKCNSPPITGQCTNHCRLLLYNGSLLCGFNPLIKGSMNTVYVIIVLYAGHSGLAGQEAQLSQRGRAMLHVTEYFALLLKVTQGHS